MVNVDKYESECVVAMAAAAEAGEILLSLLGKAAVSSKGVNDWVTTADLAAQSAIENRLLHAFPSDQFVGEEVRSEPMATPAERSPTQRVWIVDPLDGTTNYVHQIPFFSVSIALLVGHDPVVGVVYDPQRGECFAATRDRAWLGQGIGLSVSQQSHLDQSVFGLGLPTELTPGCRSLKMMTGMSCRSGGLRRLGSTALGLAYVAAGRLDGFWAEGIKSWDMAAGVCLVRAAGGAVSQLDRTSWLPDAGNCVASNGRIHGDLITALEEAAGFRVAWS